MTRERATATGLATTVIWASFVLLAVLTRPMPPLLLTAATFAIGGLTGLAWAAARGRLHVLRQIGWKVVAMGTIGLLGYHAIYLTALRIGPPAEVMLVNNLWPLLVVLGSALLPGETLRPGHVLGGAIAFAGAALVVAGGTGAGGTGSLLGYGLALSAATVWASYSLLSRRMGAVPTESVALFCLGTAVLALPLHLMFEVPAAPASALGWAALVALGLGPVGFAFYAWDIGVKHGNVQLLGVASYVTPLLSTLALVLTAVTEPRPILLVSACLILAGALIAARAGRRPLPTPG